MYNVELYMGNVELYMKNIHLKMKNVHWYMKNVLCKCTRIYFQELLVQKKEKLKIQEQIMKEKSCQETEINKVIEAKKRRGKYCEKELMEKIVFEKPSKKH